MIGAGHDLWRALRPSARVAPVQALEAPVAGVLRDSAAASGEGQRARAEAVLDLNRAVAAELDSLPGIGPVLAARIVEHRRRYGPFRRVEELRAVRGVGPRLLARLRPRVTVGGPAPVEP